MSKQRANQQPSNVRPMPSMSDWRREREQRQAERRAEREEQERADDAREAATLLPQNVDAEAGVLGSILIDPEALSLVRESGLQSEHFYRESHRLIYAAMVALDDAHEPVDLITVCDALARGGHLEAVGGTAAVSSLANQVPTSVHAVAYAQKVVKLAQARAIIAIAGQIAAAAYTDPERADLGATALQLLLDAGVRSLTGTGGSVSLADAIQEHLGDVLAIAEGQVVGLTTGFPALDAALGGLYPGELALVCARPGVGKSTLAVQAALAQAEWLSAHGQAGTVEYVTLEMPARQQAKRLLTNLAGQDGRLVRRGFLRVPGEPSSFDNAAWDRYDATAQAVAARVGQRIFLRDRSTHLAELRAHLSLAVARRGCQVAIIDYVGLVRSENPRATDYSRMSEIAREMKQIARDLNIVVVALCQFNRALEARNNHRPQLADLRDTGEWEQSADVVLALHRPMMFDPARAEREPAFAALTEVILLKARENIPNQFVPLWFKAAFTRLEPWPEGVAIPEDESRPEGTQAGTTRTQRAGQAEESEGYETW